MLGNWSNVGNEKMLNVIFKLRISKEFVGLIKVKWKMALTGLKYPAWSISRSMYKKSSWSWGIAFLILRDSKSESRIQASIIHRIKKLCLLWRQVHKTKYLPLKRPHYQFTKSHALLLYSGTFIWFINFQNNVHNMFEGLCHLHKFHWLPLVDWMKINLRRRFRNHFDYPPTVLEHNEMRINFTIYLLGIKWEFKNCTTRIQPSLIKFAGYLMRFY